MSWQHWIDNGWLRSHRTSAEEISKLFVLADRYLSAAQQSISLDGKFLAAYHAALNLCSILLYAQGYRPARERQHHRTIQAVPLILGSDRLQDAKYLDDCRIKRNMAQYESAGVASKDEVVELISFAKTFRSDVLDWLRLHHPELLKEETD